MADNNPFDEIAERMRRALEPLRKLAVRPVECTPRQPDPAEWPSLDLDEASMVEPIDGRDLRELIAKAGAQPQRQPAGRPPGEAAGQLRAAALMWLDLNGIPERQAELERALLDWAARFHVETSERSVRDIARAAIARARQE